MTCSQVKMLPSFQQNGFTNLSHPRHDSPIRMGLWPAYPGLEGITIRFTKIRGKYGAWAAPNDMIKSGTFRRHPTPGAARKRIRHFGLVLVHHNKAGWADERARCHSKLMRCEMLLLQDFQSFRAIGNILTRFSILSSRCFPCFKFAKSPRFTQLVLQVGAFAAPKVRSGIQGQVNSQALVLPSPREVADFVPAKVQHALAKSSSPT